MGASLPWPWNESRPQELPRRLQDFGQRTESLAEAAAVQAYQRRRGAAKTSDSNARQH